MIFLNENQQYWRFVMKTKVCLLYGGKSAEHEVSLQTAKAVTEALDLEKFDVYPVHINKEGQWIKGPKLERPAESVEDLQFSPQNQESTHPLAAFLEGGEEFDVVFPLLHGPNGEDGTVQGMLELLNIPYVGNGVLASAAGMDKVIMKHIFAEAGLAQVDYVWFTRSHWEKNQEETYELTEKEIGYPCFVKPANLGSSVGINKCSNRDELEKAFKEAFQYDRKIIVEQGVKAREIEMGVLGNDDPKCSVPGEIVPKKEFYDYKAKYQDNSTQLIIPAEISEKVKAEMEQIAIKAFQALDCSGLVRADFFLTEDGRVLINEVNTMPGFTPVSMFPLLWKHSGLDYPQLIETLIDLAIKRHEEKQKIKYTV
jgi:D-alanine-D-alanine ligase